MELNKLCRTCLSASENMKSLYETCATSTNISCAKLLMTIAPIICLETDGLPTQMCNRCITDLNRLNTFRLKCLESDATLRNRLNNKTAENNMIEKVYLKCDSPVILTNNNRILVEKSNSENNRMHLSDVTMEQNDALRNHKSADRIEEVLIKSEFPGCLDNNTIFEEIANPNIVTFHSQDIVQQSNRTGISLKDPLQIDKVQEVIDQEIDLVKCEVDVKVEMDEDINIEVINAPAYQQEEEKPYSCSVCNKSYRNRSELKVHMQIMHTGVKPYACTACDQSFITNEHLTYHMRSHNRKKSHSCTYCNKPSKSKGGLKTHMRTHTTETPYLCSVCNIYFKTKQNITTHMRTHTGKKHDV